MIKNQPTRSEMYTFKRSILSYLRQNPGSKSTEIASGVGEDLKRVQNTLASMTNAGMLRSWKSREKRLVFSNLRGAFQQLEEEYSGVRIHRTNGSDDAGLSIYTQAKNSETITRDNIAVEIVPSKIMLTISGEKRALELKEAETLYRQLKNALGMA